MNYPPLARVFAYAVLIFMAASAAGAAPIGKPFAADNAATSPEKIATMIETGHGFAPGVTTDGNLAVYRELGYPEARDARTFAAWMRSDDIEVVACGDPRLGSQARYVHLVPANGNLTVASLERCRPGDAFAYSRRYGRAVVKLGCANPVSPVEDPSRIHMKRTETSAAIIPGDPTWRQTIPLHQDFFLGLGRGPSIGWGTTGIFSEGTTGPHVRRAFRSGNSAPP